MASFTAWVLALVVFHCSRPGPLVDMLVGWAAGDVNWLSQSLIKTRSIIWGGNRLGLAVYNCCEKKQLQDSNLRPFRIKELLYH